MSASAVATRSHVVTLLVSSTLVAAGCGGAAPTGPAGPAGAPQATAKAAASPAASATTGEEWKCDGALVPPNGWQQETAMTSAYAANARGTALDTSVRRLRERLCGRGGSCEFLDARVKGWKTGSNGTDVCGMAVISSDDLDDWRIHAESAALLDGKLASAAKEVLAGLSTPAGVVGMDAIVDEGVAGGARAEWLRARMERALQAHGAVRAVPAGWAGNGVPKGFERVIRGEIVQRVERQIRTLEVNWVAIAASGAKTRSAPVVFPESASPVREVPAAAVVADSGDALTLRLDSSHAGGLCEGERTQLWLHADAPLHVRLINLYGDSGAILLFPGAEPSDLVDSGQTVPMGGKMGLEAVPVPGSEFERFLVIGAPKTAGLGSFATTTRGPCRLPESLARELHRGRGIPPGAQVGITGYRLLKAESCGTAPSPAARERAARALQSIPECGN